MRSYARMVRVLTNEDYQDIKAQAKTKRTTLKTLAVSCGCSYKQFRKFFDGTREATIVAETLMVIGYTLKETK